MNPAIDPSQPSPRPRKNRFAWVLQAPGKRSNFIAVIAATLFLLGLTTPAGPFFLPEPNGNILVDFVVFFVLLVPYYFYSGVLLVFTAVPLILFGSLELLFSGGSSWSWSLFLFMMPLWLWFLVSTNWLIRGLAHGIAKLSGNGAALRPRSRSSWTRWAVVPGLILLLGGIHATQLPMKLAFAMQKPALEKIADQAIAAPSGEVLFEDNQVVGFAEAFAAYRLPLSNDPKAWEESEQTQYEKKAAEQSVTSILIHTSWEHAGYVRDLSRKPDELTGTLFRLDPKSKFNYNQTLYYLGDGWYAYQNAIDW